MRFPIASVSFSILLLMVCITKPSYAQTELGSLRSPCINTAVAGTVPDDFGGGENLFSSGEFDDTLRAETLSEPLIVRLLMEGLGIFRDIALVEFNFKNACAAIDKSTNQRIIYFDKDWLNDYSGDDFWIKVGIFAHEIGHHVNNHTYESDSVARIRREHEADVFAGAAIAALGGSLDDALAFSSKQPSRWSNTHPGRATRRASITEGYQRFSQVRSRIAIFSGAARGVSGQYESEEPTEIEPSGESTRVSKNDEFSRALIIGMLNTLRAPDDPVYRLKGAHENNDDDDETTQLNDIPSKFKADSKSEKDIFLGDVFGGVSKFLIDHAVRNYLNQYRQILWGSDFELQSLRKPIITIRQSYAGENSVDFEKYCVEYRPFETFLENYFIFTNIYASFYERALGSDHYITDTGDDFTKFKSDGYIIDPITSSKLSLDNALEAGFAPVLERVLLSVSDILDESWKSEIKEFLVAFLDYREINQNLIENAKLKKLEWSEEWAFDGSTFNSPFRCNQKMPRLYAQIQKYNNSDEPIYSYIGTEMMPLEGNIESRILGFWLRRNAAGTGQILAESLQRLVAKL